MRSLYTRILVTAAATLTVSLVCFLTVYLTVGQSRMRSNFQEIGRLEIDAAMDARDHGGDDNLRRFITRLDNAFGSRHWVMDRTGRDVLTGEDLTPMLPRAAADVLTGEDLTPILPRNSDSQILLLARDVVRRVVGAETTSVNWSTDGRFALVTISTPWSSVRAQMPYYLLIVLASSVLNSLIAIRVVRSLRTMARAAENIGAGNLEVRVSGDHRKDELGNLARAFNAMTDRIRALLTAERRLLQDVSHELRSPLARLAFAAELARTSPDRDGAIDQINRQIDSLTALVTSLLEASRTENLTPDLVDGVVVSDILQEVIDASSLHLQERECRVIVHAMETPPIRGNPTLIRRAIDNVLRNAIHYSPAGSPIELSVAHSGRAITIAVRDCGPGVPEHLLERVFEPFFRVDDSRNASTGGTGLGLAIVQRVAAVHEGSVRAENSHPGLKVTLVIRSVRVDEPRARSAA